MTMIRRVEVLRRAAAILAAVANDEEVADAGRRLQRWLGHGAGTLDALFGLEAEQGARSWRTILAHYRRDELLRHASRRYGMSAEELAAALHRYFETAWQREKREAICPNRHKGTVEHFLWSVLRQKPYPIREKQMREILGGELGHLTSESLFRESMRATVKVKSNRRFDNA